MFSAAALNMATRWSSPTVTIASIADSTTAETCASLSLRRAAASSNSAVRWRTAVSRRAASGFTSRRIRSTPAPVTVATSTKANASFRRKGAKASSRSILRLAAS